MGCHLQKKHRDHVCEWEGRHETTINTIRTTAEKLVTHNQNVNISHITGSLVAIGGSGVAILGFALNTVTFGAAIGLTIVGAVVATAGGATAAGASIVDTVITKTGVKEAQAQLEFDQDKLKEIELIQDQIKEQNEKIKEKCPDLKKVDIFRVTDVISYMYVQQVAKTANLAFRVGEVARISAAEFGALGLRSAGIVRIASGVVIAGIVLNVVVIPIDVIEIVRSGWNIKKGNESKASKKTS